MSGNQQQSRESWIGKPKTWSWFIATDSWKLAWGTARPLDPPNHRPPLSHPDAILKVVLKSFPCLAPRIMAARLVPFIPLQKQEIGGFLPRVTDPRENTYRRVHSIKIWHSGLPWWCSGWESACQSRGHGFHLWSGKIPHAAQQLSPWPQLLSLRSRARETQLLSLRATVTEAGTPRARALQQEKPPQWEARAPQGRVAPARLN